MLNSEFITDDSGHKSPPIRIEISKLCQKKECRGMQHWESHIILCC